MEVWMGPAMVANARTPLQLLKGAMRMLVGRRAGWAAERGTVPGPGLAAALHMHNSDPAVP